MPSTVKKIAGLLIRTYRNLHIITDWLSYGQRKIQHIEKLIQHGQIPAALNASSELKVNLPPRSEYRYLLAYAVALELGNEIESSIQHRLKALIINPKALDQWAKLVDQEQKSKYSHVYDYYNSHKDALPQQVKLFLTAKFSCTHSSVYLNWEEALNYAREMEYNAIFINTLITTAFIRNKQALSDIEALLFSKLTFINQHIRIRSFRQLALTYYKSGNQDKIKSLSKRLSFNDDTWKMAITFGQGDPVNGMTHRTNVLASAFLLVYDGEIRADGIRTLYPEKDLCGDVFLPFFFKNEYTKNGAFRVICDERLYTILTRSFPNLQFTAKTPPNQYKLKPHKFTGISSGLAKFIDHDAQQQIEGSHLFKIYAHDHFFSENCQNNRENGWLIPDSKKVEYWCDYFSKAKDEHLIGFSAGSTLKAPNRDIHMIDIEHWESIFRIPGGTFINLNSSFSKENCLELQQLFQVKIISLDFIDLYNDFENLLALMSVLDFAIVPANNMMDMASAIALDSLVFSPTGIMSNWIPQGYDSYLFSRHVQFITPDSDTEDYASMVSRAAEQIKKRLSLN